MNGATRPAALGGRIFTPTVLVLAAVAALGAALIAWRFAVGLGASTAMNDGYAWGIWIAFDVVTGTAIGCGGYGIAMLVFILNRGQYHPLVRPALLTSALGYSIAGLSVLLDLGRPWLTWKIPVFVWSWNLQSQLLEVALCIMAYSTVLWLELSPAMLERAAESSSPALQRFAKAWLPRIRGSMLWITSLGLLLPTMHQSALGSLLLLAGPRLDPLWNTPLLPLLFLISCVLMGFGAVVIEGSLATRYFGRRAETGMLADLGRVMAGLSWVYLAIRCGDLAWRGQARLLVGGDVHATMWLLEILLFAAAALMLRSDESRRDPGNLFRAAMALLLAGSVYRFDVFLLAFSPGQNWHYFPSVAEILITTGLVAGEMAVYIVFVRIFPILPSLSVDPHAAIPAPSRAARGLS